MGGKNSVVIQFDTKVPQAGNTLEGHVVVNIRSRLRATKSSLYIYGQEVVAGTKHGVLSESEEKHFFYRELELERYCQTQKITRGIYTYPFSFELPESLPSSACRMMGSKKGFRVEYQAIASIGKLACKKEFKVIAKPLPDEPESRVVHPVSIPVYALGVFNKGTVSFGASLDNAIVGKGKTLQLNLACQNDSTADIRRVEIKIIEECKWNAPMTSSMDNSMRKILIKLKDVDLPGLVKNRTDRNSVHLSLNSPLRRSKTLDTVHEALTSGTSKVAITIPNDSLDSFTGELISVSHYMEIHLQTPIMVNHHSTTIPIIVGTPPMNDQLDLPSEASEQSPANQSEVLPIHPGISDEDIPMASTVVMEEERQMSLSKEESCTILLEADTIHTATSSDLSDITPMVPPSHSDRKSGPSDGDRPTLSISLSTLHDELRTSTNPLDILATKVSEKKWCDLLASLSPDEFGSIVQFVPREVDQPLVALFLSPYVNGIRGMSCAYAAAAVKNSSQWVRTATVQRLVPVCYDIVKHYDLIKAELSERERLATHSNFEEALRELSTM